METLTYNYGEPGLDSVRCNNCMRLVGVATDSDVCPACGYAIYCHSGSRTGNTAERKD